MKEQHIAILNHQKDKGSGLVLKVENVANMQDLDKLTIEYEEWDKVTSEILEKGFVHSQLFRMYSGVTFLGNVYIDKNSFQHKRGALLHCLPQKIMHLSTAIKVTETAKSTDLLPLGEKIISLTTITPISHNMKKIFISHASVDQAKIRPLIDLIEGIGVPPAMIFFSSHPAYGVPLGENIFEHLKTELSSDVFALFILSESFYKSPVCLCEMGAVWIKSNKQIPILIPPFDFSDVKGVFPNSLGFKINDRNQLNSFKAALEEYFDLTPIHLNRWEEKRDDYLSKINALL